MAVLSYLRILRIKNIYYLYIYFFITKSRSQYVRRANSEVSTLAYMYKIIYRGVILLGYFYIRTTEADKKLPLF